MVLEVVLRREKMILSVLIVVPSIQQIIEAVHCSVAKLYFKKINNTKPATITQRTYKNTTNSFVKPNKKYSDV